MAKINIDDIAVSSAKKLATPVNIWGNSFDGTKDIDGTITFPYKTTQNSPYIQAYNADNTNLFAIMTPIGNLTLYNKYNSDIMTIMMNRTNSDIKFSNSIKVTGDISYTGSLSKTSSSPGNPEEPGILSLDQQNKTDMQNIDIQLDNRGG